MSKNYDGKHVKKANWGYLDKYGYLKTFEEKENITDVDISELGLLQRMGSPVIVRGDRYYPIDFKIDVDGETYTRDEQPTKEMIEAYKKVANRK